MSFSRNLGYHRRSETIMSIQTRVFTPAAFLC